MDDIDADGSNEREQMLLDATVANIRKKANQIPVNESGVCWTCGDPVPDLRRWCSADCRDLAEIDDVR